MSRRPIPPELASYPADTLRAELARRDKIDELKCALNTYLKDLRKCASAAKLHRDFTSNCIEWLEAHVDPIAEDMYMNSISRAGPTSSPVEASE